LSPAALFRRTLFRFALCFLAGGTYQGRAQAAGASERAEAKKDLARLREKILAARKEALAAEKKEEGVLSELSRLEQRIEEADETVGSCEKEIERNMESLSECEEELEQLDRELKRIRGSLSRAVRALYRVKRVTTAEVFLGSAPLSAHVRRRAYLGSVAEELAGLSSQAKEKSSRALERGEELRRITEKQRALKVQAEENKEALESSRAKREALLERIRSEVATQRDALMELEEAENALQRFMGDLEDISGSEGDQAIPFAAKKGSLPWPVMGKVLKRFGKTVDPALHTTLLHKGLDIGASKGETVRCVHDGKVLFADWFRGYGKLVIVDHGGGYCTLYAHNDEVRVETGSPVSASQPIAEVGDTGSLGGAKLYFEVRKDNLPVDPLEWLSRR